MLTPTMNKLTDVRVEEYGGRSMTMESNTLMMEIMSWSTK